MNRRELFVRAAASASAVIVPNFFLLGHDEPLEGRVALFDWIREIVETGIRGSLPGVVRHDVGILSKPRGGLAVMTEILGVQQVLEPGATVTAVVREIAAERLREEMLRRGIGFDRLWRLDNPALPPVTRLGDTVRVRMPTLKFRSIG